MDIAERDHELIRITMLRGGKRLRTRERARS